MTVRSEMAGRGATATGHCDDDLYDLALAALAISGAHAKLQDLQKENKNLLLLARRKVWNRKYYKKKSKSKTNNAKSKYPLWEDIRDSMSGRIFRKNIA